MRSRFNRNVVGVIVVILLVGLASGMSISVLALYLDEHHFDKSSIGSLAAIFASGIALGALTAGKLLSRISGKALLVGTALLYACTLALFPSAIQGYWWVALDRFFDGMAAAGIWVGCETILLNNAGKDDKAFLTGIYAAAIGLGYLLGPFASRGVVAFASMDATFYIAAGQMLLTGVLSLLIFSNERYGEGHKKTRDASEPIPPSGLSIQSVAWRIKCSLFGNFAYGYFQASAVLFLPLYLVGKHIPEEQTIVVPGFFALGMLISVIPAGMVGDRVGHLLTMRVLAVVGGIVVLGFVFIDLFWLMCIAITVAGATLATIAPVSLALQGVILRPADYARGNALYNGIYALGMLMGPAISGYLYEHASGEAMLYQMGGLWLAFFIFAQVFSRDDPRTRRQKVAAPVAVEPGG